MTIVDADGSTDILLGNQSGIRPMRMILAIATVLAAAFPLEAAAQDPRHQVIRMTEESLVTLRIMDRGFGIMTLFYPAPRTVNGHRGVDYQTNSVVANCDARTMRVIPVTYFDAAGTEIGTGAVVNTPFAAVVEGSLEADILDVECGNKRASLLLLKTNEQILVEYRDVLAARRQ